MSDLLEKPRESFARLNSDGEIEIVCEKTGLVLAKQGGLKDHVAQLKRAFDPTLGDIIANRIIEGESLTKICRDPLMPSLSTIARWRRQSEDFDSLIRYAYEERAHYHHDLALEIAESTTDKDEVAVNKLKIETYRWTAERTNQRQFAAKQTKVEGVSVNTQIIVTGVPQPDSVEDAVDITPLGDEGGEAASDISDIGTTGTSGGESHEAE